MKEISVDVANLAMTQSGRHGEVAHLVGRDIGRKVREALAESFSEQEGETVFHLDFSRVGVVDYSSADEMLGKLVPRLLADEFGPKFICLTRISPHQTENLSVALEKRGMAVAALPRGGGWVFLGKLDPYLRETFNIVYNRRRISAKELSISLSLALNTGSTRLLNLYKKRLVGRRENSTTHGYREYIYISFGGGFQFA